MQTPSPMVLRMRLACCETSARSSGRKSPVSEKMPENWSLRSALIASSMEEISTTCACCRRASTAGAFAPEWLERIKTLFCGASKNLTVNGGGTGIRRAYFVKCFSVNEIVVHSTGKLAHSGTPGELNRFNPHIGKRPAPPQ